MNAKQWQQMLAFINLWNAVKESGNFSDASAFAMFMIESLNADAKITWDSYVYAHTLGRL